MSISFSCPLIPAPLTLEYLRSALRVLPHTPPLFHSLTLLVLGVWRGLEEGKTSPRQVLSAAGVHVSGIRYSLGAAFSFCQLPSSVQGSRGCLAPSQGFMLPTPRVGGCHLAGLSSPSTSAKTLPPRAVEMWGEQASLHPFLFSELVPTAPSTSSRLSPYSVSVFSFASELLGTYIRLSPDFFPKGAYRFSSQQACCQGRNTLFLVILTFEMIPSHPQDPPRSFEYSLHLDQFCQLSLRGWGKGVRPSPNAGRSLRLLLLLAMGPRVDSRAVVKSWWELVLLHLTKSPATSRK